jgi:hypothetical protein
MLRTTISIALLIFLLKVESSAQVCRSYGIKMGVSYSDLEFGTYKPGLTARIPGLGGAVFVEWFNTPHFSVITQLELTQRGSIIDIYSTEDFGSRTIGLVGDYNRLHYLSAPILAKWAFSRKALSPYVLLGPRVDYLLWYATDSGFLDGTYKEFNKLIVGGSAAIGCDSGSLLPITLVAEVRYDFDFGNSSKYHESTIRKDSFDLWLGWTF